MAALSIHCVNPDVLRMSLASAFVIREPRTRARHDGDHIIEVYVVQMGFGRVCQGKSR